ncbi:hypothetical protein B0H19DRAFT_1384600 [Mycena capillaripes]|nr:hypothetical protein B0H19DRAFT_1384600 [Mycena capillaripes]
MAAQFLVLPAFVELSEDWYIIPSHKATTFRSTSHRHIQISRLHGQTNAFFVVLSCLLSLL